MATTDDGTFYDDDMRMVTVVDRVGPGGAIQLKSGATLPGTYYWDLKPHAVQPKFSLRAPAAKHFMKYASQAYIHDASGAYVCRLGIEAGDESLIAEIGPEYMNCEPLDVDQDAIEHWDTGAVDPTDRKSSKRVRRSVPESVAAMRAREEG